MFVQLMSAYDQYMIHTYILYMYIFHNLATSNVHETSKALSSEKKETSKALEAN